MGSSGCNVIAGRILAGRIIAGSLGALAISACAGAYPDAPPNMPPPLTLEELTGTPGVLRADMVRPTGPAVIAAGVVASGGAMITIPYRYKYTAVLTEDVTGHSITVRGVQLTKGSSGFYAGTFNGGRYANGPKDMWCFLRSEAGASKDPLCLFRMLPGVAAIAPTRDNPYMWFGFQPMTGSFNMVNTPIFERREVAIPGDLKLEYRFGGWTDSGANIEEYAVGRHVHRYEYRRAVDGGIEVTTVAGVLRIEPAPGNVSSAVVSLKPLPVPL